MCCILFASLIRLHMMMKTYSDMKFRHENNTQWLKHPIVTTKMFCQTHKWSNQTNPISTMFLEGNTLLYQPVGYVYLICYTECSVIIVLTMTLCKTQLLKRITKTRCLLGMKKSDLKIVDIKHCIQDACQKTNLFLLLSIDLEDVAMLQILSPTDPGFENLHTFYYQSKDGI